MSASGVAAALSVAAGVAGSVPVAMMSRFGERIGLLPALAFATGLTGVLALIVLIVFRQSLAGYADALRQPPWLWITSVMGLFVVFTIAFAGARIGVAATIGLVIAGQLAMGAAIDRFGLFGVKQIPLHWPRVLGIALLAAGAALSLRR